MMMVNFISHISTTVFMRSKWEKELFVSLLCVLAKNNFFLLTDTRDYTCTHSGFLVKLEHTVLDHPVIMWSSLQFKFGKGNSSWFLPLLTCAQALLCSILYCKHTFFDCDRQEFWLPSQFLPALATLWTASRHTPRPGQLKMEHTWTLILISERSLGRCQ